MAAWTRRCCSAASLAALLLVTLPVLAQRAPAAGQPPAVLFQTSDRCIACHNGLTAPSGEDVSIGFDWRPTMMANAGRDPYWQAGVRRETLDHPEARAAIEDECSICHMPMARARAKIAGRPGGVFAHLPFDPRRDDDRFASDGVSCSLCHQITAEKLGTRDSFVGGFVIDTTHPRGERAEYGPYEVDPGHVRIMRSSSGGFVPTRAGHVQDAELCATCHTLYTTTLGPRGEAIGELPEQMPYQEWLHSSYRGTRTCQSCHMPAVKEPVPLTPVFGEPRQNLARHVFVGGNFFMLQLLNRFRADLDVDALPQELDRGALRTLEHLQAEAAAVSITSLDLRGDRLEAVVATRNLGGHKLPTAYPSRRVWLHVLVRDRDGRTLFESGALEPSGLIRGNDNDADANRFEPHYKEISSPDQVQIYEAIMADAAGRPTTGLLQATRYIKDNRLLPSGFDKGTASRDIAVQGEATADPGFSDAGHAIRYAVAVGNAPAPFSVVAELWYQPIGYRWARNLERYDAFEPKRFVGLYNSAASHSAALLAQARAAR